MYLGISLDSKKVWIRYGALQIPVEALPAGLELNRVIVADLPSVHEDLAPEKRSPEKMSERVPDEIIELVLDAELERDWHRA